MKYYTYKVDKHGTLLNESYGVVDPYYHSPYGDAEDPPQRRAYQNFMARRIAKRNPEYEAVLVFHAACDYNRFQDGMDFDYWLYDRGGEVYPNLDLDRKLGLI